MVSLSVSSVKNNMLAAYLAHKIFPQPRQHSHKKSPQPVLPVGEGLWRLWFSVDNFYFTHRYYQFITF